jgi:SCP-2 sterol transfer family
MIEFPPEPISPAEFLEDWLPRAFDEVGAPEDTHDVDLRLGVRIEGEGGGEWVVHMKRGRVFVTRQPRDDTALSYVQSLADWRGSLWEGRGGAIGKHAGRLLCPGARPVQAIGGLGGPPSPRAIEAMTHLDGLVRLVVSGGEGGDWAIAFKLGPGPIPAEPTTSLIVSAADAAAMDSGQLNPMEAFMAGRIQVTGDIALLLQMQAIQMQVAAQGL